MRGATGNLYCGLHEFEDMGFILHALRKSDTFVDIGANVGSYTLLAANEVGANTISVEPIPSTFEILEQNLNINKIREYVTALNIGLGAKKGELKFTKSKDTMNHVALDDSEDTIAVPIEKFDDVIKLTSSTLIKIDVEGFETEVLNGMSEALPSPHLKAIIIELNGSGKKYGYEEEKIHEKLVAFGFAPFLYRPFERKLQPIESYGKYNTIYIRNIDFIKSRIESAKKIEIHGQIF